MLTVSTTKENQSEGVCSFHVEEHEHAPLKTWHYSSVPGVLLNFEDAFDFFLFLGIQYQDKLGAHRKVYSTSTHTHLYSAYLKSISNLPDIEYKQLLWERRRKEKKCGCSAWPQLLFQRMKLRRQIGFQRTKMCGAPCRTARDRSLVEFSPVINNLTTSNLFQLLTCAQPLNGTSDIWFHKNSGRGH